jgi:hypothetical protein
MSVGLNTQIAHGTELPDEKIRSLNVYASVPISLGQDGRRNGLCCEMPPSAIVKWQ